MYNSLQVVIGIVTFHYPELVVVECGEGVPAFAVPCLHYFLGMTLFCNLSWISKFKIYEKQPNGKKRLHTINGKVSSC